MGKISALILCFIALVLNGCNNEDKEKVISKTNDSITTSRPIPSEASVNPYAQVDVSPMDMSYFPVEYPKLKTANGVSAPPLVRVIYSRPHLSGRKLFHELLKYGEPWRLGANESTEIQFYKDVTIQGNKVKAGRYVLYAIPQAATWTIILNSNIDSWGLKPDSTKDVARFDIPVTQNVNHLEYFTIIFEKTNTGADLLMAWDDVEARLPISF